MSTQKFIVTTLAGFGTLFLLGFLLYGIALVGFFEAQVGSATGVIRNPPLFWAIGLGNLAMSALLTIIIGKWSGVSGAGNGAQIGAVFGFMVATGIDFILYGTSNTTTLAGAVGDIGVSTVLYAVTGAVIGVMLARK